ncbi:protein-glutamate O-methyltransferase CheR [Granulicella sp. dw_53]|uniref:CheR family methyltransferase n=1 Tax=Granulicella sp. dw_53 TaxID=2719792 RepID=UPI001BD5FFE1|nr:protein-glutamate O-methyltransferase CheR [Granulicella sp. dw_53]
MPGSALILGDSIPKLHSDEYGKISKLVYEHCGLDLREGKQSFIAVRLGKTLRELRLSSFQVYLEYVRADRTGVALASMVDHLTTNHTSFFREPSHFDFLCKDIFPALRARPPIHIWSAGCSSGEEPYSIAISLMEEYGMEAAERVRILGTDISLRVLERARRGVYPAERFEGLPVPLLQRYLLKGHNASAQSYRIKSAIRSMVEFEYLNLMGQLPENYRCSVIFCRNVMIYFDKPTQQNLVARLTDHLEQGGYLLIGHSESLNTISHGLDYVSPAIYRKPNLVRSFKIGRY